MSSEVLGAAGAVVGFVITGGNPQGAQIGWMIGSATGSLLFPPKGPDGPRLNDLSVQASTYGIALARSWGTTRRAGNVIWSAGLQEHAHEEGGKGGPSYTTYSYTCSFAVSFGEGPIVGIRRMWAGGKLIYDVSAGNTGATKDFTATSFVIYTGSETQGVDPTIQAAMTNAPAYRGQCYVVFADLELEKFGNRLPFDLQAEIVVDGTFSTPAALTIGSGGDSGIIDPLTSYLWSIDHATSPGNSTLYVNDPISGLLVKSIVIDQEVKELTYVNDLREFWAVSGGNSDFYQLVRISADAIAVSAKISITGNGAAWPNYIVYASANRHIYIGSGNIYINRGIYEYDINGSSLGLVPGTGGTVTRAIIDLPEARCITFVDTAGVLRIIDANNGITQVHSSGYSGSAAQCIAYDGTRNQILWTDDGTLTHCYVVDVESKTLTQKVFSPNLSFGIWSLIYHKQLDTFIAIDVRNNLLLIDVETHAVYKTISTGISHLVDNSFLIFEQPQVTDYVTSISPGNIARRLYLDERITPNKDAVSDIITDISVDVGLTAGDIDVTDLTGVLSDGFLLARQGSGRSAIEQLMMGYQFDAVESVGKVKFVRRGTRPAAVIDADSLAVHEPGQDMPTALTLKRADEVELPRSLTVKYMNIGADHQIGAQSSIRQTVRSVNDVTWDLPIVMNDSQAKAIADAGHYSAWAARTTAKFSTTLKYADKEPTDIVSAEGNQIRITKRSLRGNILDFEGALDSGMVFAGGAASGAAQSVAQTIPYRSNTAIEFMDIPLLRDQDNDAGFYVAASGYSGQTWDGCVIFKSSDGGGSWDEVATMTTAATAGAASTALGDFSQNVFDEFNTVTVRLRNGTLSSISELAVLNGGNAALLGNEIIQFRTATLNGDGSYTLSGLLRGRKGSLTSGHAIGDRFVLLNTTSVRRIDMSTAEIGLERLYKAVSVGDTLAGTTSKAFTNTAVGLECLSGVQLGGGRDASQNLTINWVRRTRVGGEWRDYADVVVGETTESYEVEIWTSGFATLKRTITGLSSPAASYTSAQQVTDFGSNQSTVYIRIYQLSASVGRGFVLQGTV